MNETDNVMPNKECTLKSRAEFDEQFKEITSREQLYSIALFDILGFSNYVENNGNKVILDLYNKLLDLIHKQQSGYSGSQSFAGDVAPVPISNDWKSGVYIAGASGCINICHFSDTFIIYVNYNFIGDCETGSQS